MAPFVGIEQTLIIVMATTKVEIKRFTEKKRLRHLEGENESTPCATRSRLLVGK